MTLQPRFVHVSYLAQRQGAAPVMLKLPECAASMDAADPQLPGEEVAPSHTCILHPCVSQEHLANAIRP
jgi:hypothetical protein